MSVKTAAYQDRSRTRTVGSPIAFYEVGGGGATRSPGAVAPYDQYFSGTSTASSDVWSIPPLRAAPVVTPSYHKNEFEQRSITLLERRGQERATRLLGFGTDFQKRNDSLERGDASPRRVDVVSSPPPSPSWPDTPTRPQQSSVSTDRFISADLCEWCAGARHAPGTDRDASGGGAAIQTRRCRGLEGEAWMQ